MTDPKETSKLAQINEYILNQINEVASGLKTRRSNVLEARRVMNKATGVIRDFDDVAHLTILVTEVSQQEHAYGEISTRLQRLQRLYNSPYFARIDFIEDGYGEAEEIYIGRHSLLDEKTHNFFVYDWRAPIASLYYDHGIGRASFKIPADTQGDLPPIEGEILLKRQYQIEKGELLYYFDSELAVDDDILRLELSKASDAKIKTIIHSIQKEQNAAIRSESKDVMVFGPAGSGKTSVGLHRLAYLLYRHRNTLSSAKVRIFSPSPIFASYIEGVIPDLGEEDVQTLDFIELIDSYSPQKRHFFDQYQQIEYLSSAKAHDQRKLWLAEKYSASFIDFFEQFIKDYTPSFEDVHFNQDLLCDKGRLSALYQDRTSAGRLSTKSGRVLTYVNQRYNEYYEKNLNTITALFNSIHDDNFSRGEIYRFYEEEKNIVLADLRNRLMPSAKRLYELALTRWAKKHKHALPISFVKAALRQDRLYFEDMLHIFYAGILTGRIASEKNVKQILIDEAQDMCILQHRILRHLFVGSHFTVLADVNQAIYADINLHTQATLEAEYPLTQKIPLTTSYRSTYEINRFATEILLGQTLDTSALYSRHGDEPAVIESDNPYATTWEIVKSLPESFNTVGILLATTADTLRFHKELLSYVTQQNDATPSPDNIKLIANNNQSFTPGIMVMALPYAKGLEFDAVICPQYGQPVFEGTFGKKMLYLTCTRALHNLYLIKELSR